MSSVEQQIAEAIRRGEFDRLPGEGKPLPKRDGGPGWWARSLVERMTASERLAEISRQVDFRLGEAWVLGNEQAVRGWVADINDEVGIEDVAVDADEIVATWHKMSRARRRSYPESG